MELTKEQYIHYSRYLLRRLGHALPPPPWIETFSWPGLQLSAFCRHCKSPFAIIGDPNYTPVTDENNRSSLGKRVWNLVQIFTEEHYDTNRAWSETRAPRVRKETITTLASYDFKGGSPMRQWLLMLANPNSPPPPEEDDPDPDAVIREKLKGINERYYCSKIRTWL